MSSGSDSSPDALTAAAALNPATALAQLPDLVRRVLLATASDDRPAQVISRRFGLAGAPQLTLEQLGIAFDLTRERVRQIEEKALRMLAAMLLSADHTAGVRVRTYAPLPEVPIQLTQALYAIVELVDTCPAQAVREDVLYECLAIDPVDRCLNVSLALLFRLAGVSRLEFSRSLLPAIWFRGDKQRRARLEQALLRLNELFTTQLPLPQDPLDVLIHYNEPLKKPERLTLVEIHGLLRICSAIEQLPDGRVQTRLHLIEGRGNQVLRLLTERGAPMDINELARAINADSVRNGKAKVEARNLSNQISADGRFTPIGKSGQWALRSERRTVNRTVVELMEEFLLERNAGASATDIYAAVASRRPVEPGSITMYLHAPGGRFAQVSRGVWGLASWEEAKNARTWSRTQVASWIAQTFRERRVQQMDFGELKQRFIDESGLSAREAQGLLGHSPAITTRLVHWNKRIATFVRDYDKALKQPAARKRSQQTLLELVATRTREILQRQPNQEAALSEIVAALTLELRRPKTSIYPYVSRLDFIESFTDPDSRQRRCRLKSTHNWANRVAKIHSTEYRDKALRALRHLNEDEVDIALFLLSKEFEVSLKAFLDDALQRGTLPKPPTNPPSKWNLNEMVRIASDNGFIAGPIRS